MTISSALLKAQWLQASGARPLVVLNAYEHVIRASEDTLCSIPLPSATAARDSDHNESHVIGRDHVEKILAMEGLADMLVSCGRMGEALDIYDDITVKRQTMLTALAKHRNVETRGEFYGEDEEGREVDGTKGTESTSSVSNLASKSAFPFDNETSKFLPKIKPKEVPSASQEFTRLQQSKCLLALGMTEEASQIIVSAHKNLSALISVQNDSDGDIWAGIEQSETTNVLKALIDPSIVTDAKTEEESARGTEGTVPQPLNKFALSESLLLLGTLATVHGDHDAAEDLLDR